MAGTFYRLIIIYLAIGMCLHLGGVQRINDSSPNQDFTTQFIEFDPLSDDAKPNNYTGMNSSFQGTVTTGDSKIATGVFGFIDTLASVLRFVTFLLTGMVFTPILLFTTYKVPAIFAYLFGGSLLIGLILGFIYLIRSGLSP